MKGQWISSERQQNLFGIHVWSSSYQSFLEKCLDSPGYSCFLNIHMFYEHSKNPDFKNVLREASFVLPDGMPIVYSLKKFNRVDQERIAGNDVIFSLIQKAKEEKLKVFLIGSTTEVLNKISKDLSLKEIEHQTYSPPFLPIDEFDLNGQATLINEFRPDMVLVGMGCPKQEIWMSRMRNKIDTPMFGIGGAFLLYAGIDSRAPEWMRKLSLEWLYRLILEPRRLFKRYLITNTYFIKVFLKRLILNR